MERLKECETDWGLTRIDYAKREKRRLREREKKRRQRSQAATRAVQEIKENLASVFRTSSGILAVRRMALSRTRLCNPAHADDSEFISISLPYVAFLYGEPAHKGEN